MNKLKKMHGEAVAEGCGVGHVNSGINSSDAVPAKFDLFSFVHI